MRRDLVSCPPTPSFRFTGFVLVLCCAVVPSVLAGPTVVPTAEGQLGIAPNADDRIVGPRFESLRGQVGDVIFGGVFIPGGAMPPPPEVQFFTDRIHGTSNPLLIDDVSAEFTNVFEVPPSVARSRNMADDGDFVAFSFAIDGSMPQTMTVRIQTFDEAGNTLVSLPIADNVGTFRDPIFSQTGIAVDSQGRVTVAYTALPGPTSEIRGTRVDATTGVVLDPDFLINDDGNHAFTDVALLDPAGNRLVVTNVELAGQGISPVRGQILDVSGGTPVVLPEFLVNDTPSLFSTGAPVVAANPATGEFTVAWEDISALQGDPIDVRARRFDADGNPIGGDFRVNTTTPNTQAQPSVAYDASNISAIAWAGDSGVQGDDLDVFLQVYDAFGNPIGGETRVNSQTAGIQDRPAVRFLPESDALGQPQVVVLWRDVGVADGSMANGTGVSYKCFSIGEDPTRIFADGFESGDTTSWSDQQP